MIGGLISSRVRHIDSSGQKLPICVIGSGVIKSNDPAHEEFLGVEYAVYASLHESSTYGFPAFWFTEPERLRAYSESTNLLILRPPKPTSVSVLTKVNIYEHSAQVDMAGLGRYSCTQIDHQEFVIAPAQL